MKRTSLFLVALIASLSITSCKKGILKNDSEVPRLIMNGGDETLYVGDNYADKGANATDDADKDIASKITISNDVNTTTPGEYKVIYNVTDKSEKAAIPLTRKVTVKIKSNNLIGQWSYSWTKKSDSFNYASSGAADITVLGTDPNRFRITYSNPNWVADTVTLTGVTNQTPFVGDVIASEYAYQKGKAGSINSTLTTIILKADERNGFISPIYDITLTLTKQ